LTPGISLVLNISKMGLGVAMGSDVVTQISFARA